MGGSLFSTLQGNNSAATGESLEARLRASRAEFTQPCSRTCAPSCTLTLTDTRVGERERETRAHEPMLELCPLSSFLPSLSSLHICLRHHCRKFVPAHPPTAKAALTSTMNCWTAVTLNSRSKFSFVEPYTNLIHVL